ncbi:hypothetical protein [Halobacteriovorax sp. HLS]|uniref:hypothetical protein n=1 Tax=Halobacteriovorax sp. HLS TaxID=2234000 RepID=UPI000FDB2CFC|nr:hypothetical protein [Halobacteriovorax sp. HLS]
MKTKRLIHFVISYFLLMLHAPVGLASQEGAASNTTTEVKEEPLEVCERPLFYNEYAKVCVNHKDNTMLNNKHIECQHTPEGPGRDECNKQLREFAGDKIKGSAVMKSRNSKLEKTGKFNTVSSLVSTGSAIYSLVKAKDAIDICYAGIAEAESGFCYAAILGLGAYVMGTYNQIKMNKEVKKDLRESTEKLNRLIAENKRSKGKSFEMQIKLMEAYRDALVAASAAAGKRENGYKQEITLHTLVMAVAAVEFVVYMSTTPAANYPGAKCAAWAGVSSGVTIGFSMLLKKGAADAKKKYNDEAAKLTQILNKYREFFSKQIISSHKLPGAETGQVIGSGNAPVNVQVNSDADGDSFANKNLTEAEKGLCRELPETGCCNDAGKQCPTFSFTSAPASVGDMFTGSGVEDIVSNTDATLQGDLDFGSPDVSTALSRDLSRARQIKKRILDHLDKSGKLTKADADFFDENKTFAALVKSATRDGKLNFNNSPDFGIGDMSNVKGVIEDTEVPKELKKEKQKLLTSIEAPVIKIKKFNLDDLDDEDSLNSNNNISGDYSNLKAGLGKDEEYVYEDEDIVKKPEVSIFNVISNRYNIMRIKKGFGQKKAK